MGGLWEELQFQKSNSEGIGEAKHKHNNLLLRCLYSFSGKHSWLLCDLRCLADRSLEPLYLTTVCHGKEGQGIDLAAPSTVLSLIDQGYPIGF